MKGDLRESILESNNLVQNIAQQSNSNWISYKINDGFDYEGLLCTLHFKNGLKLESYVNKDNVVEFKGFDSEDFDYLHLSDLEDSNQDESFSNALLKRI